MSPQRDDLTGLKSRVRLSDYVSRHVKLTSGKRDRFGRCPFHDEKSPSFTVNDAKGFYHCFGCGAHGDVFDWLQRIEGLDQADAIERVRRDAGAMERQRPVIAAAPDRDQSMLERQAEARAIWTATVPIEGTIAETYLRDVRCIGLLSPLPPSLRFHPGLPIDYQRRDLMPAMVAAVTDLDGAVVAIQRTFLKADGSGKAEIKGPKRSLGPVGQGAVCLGPGAPLMGLAEGIETGLSAMQLFQLPVWCALGSNLARIILPASARQIVIFADRGDAGERAATAARAELHSQRRQVAVRFSRTGKDFNDDLKARRRGE